MSKDWGAQLRKLLAKTAPEQYPTALLSGIPLYGNGLLHSTMSILNK
jgi:hypothetical protein